MFFMDVYIETDPVEFPRTRDHQSVGTWEKLSVAPGTTCENCSNGIHRNLQPRHSESTFGFASYRSALAGAVFGSSMCRIGKRCAAPRSYTENLDTEDQNCGRSNPAYDSSLCNALEYTNYGQSPRTQPADDSSDMEAT